MLANPIICIYIHVFLTLLLWYMSPRNPCSISCYNLELVHQFSPGAYRAACSGGWVSRVFFPLTLFRVSPGLSHDLFSSPHSSRRLYEVQAKISGHRVMNMDDLLQCTVCPIFLARGQRLIWVPRRLIERVFCEVYYNKTFFGKAFCAKIYMYARIRDRSVTPVFMFHYCFLSTFKVF